MFELSLRGWGGVELPTGHHPAVHSARTPPPHPCLPHPGLSYFSLRWSDEEMRQGGHLSCHWPKLGRAKCLSFQKLFQFEKKKRRKRLLPDLGAQGLGSPCHPQSLGPLLGHHFLELWVLVQVTPISSLDLKLLDLKAPPGHISLSQLLLPTCSDSREWRAEPGGKWAQRSRPSWCFLGSGATGGFYQVRPFLWAATVYGLRSTQFLADVHCEAWEPDGRLWPWEKRQRMFTQYWFIP